MSEIVAKIEFIEYDAGEEHDELQSGVDADGDRWFLVCVADDIWEERFVALQNDLREVLRRYA